MIQKIPSDIELFNVYINKTDDCQLSLVEETVYPLNADGTINYSSTDTKVVSEPAWKRWKLPEEESKQWSFFRKQHDALYRVYTNAKGAEKKRQQKLLNKNISDFIAYATTNGIQERLMRNGNITDIQREAFGIQQDILEYKTPLRTITLKYEKQIPLSAFEKELLAKYVALHNEVPVRSQKLCNEIKELHDSIPELWPKMWVAKEKADKAGNVICMPPPEMKGDWSPMVQFYVPTAEEQQQLVDDCNAYFKQFDEELRKISEPSDALYEQVYEEEEDEDDEKQKTLFGEVNKMVGEVVHNWANYSLNSSILYDDFDDFKGPLGEEDKKVTEAWDSFIDEYNAFVDVYSALADFLNERAERKEEQTEATSDVAVDETDDLRMETIQRYESGMSGNPYFDVIDWHIVMDHYEHKYDEKNKAIALEKAFAQHPENATLLLRKAQEEAGKHEYKKALALVKRAEAQDTQHHPNLFLIKASIYCQMHAPEKAIPLYNKLINAKGVELKWFHERARTKLIEIYDEQEKYAECMRLSKELVEIYPKNESFTANLAYYYRLNGMVKESEEALTNFLKEFPSSATCLEQLGHHYGDTKEYDKATVQFQQAYEVDKQENYENLLHKGYALIALKYFKSAVVCFETCVLHYRFGKEYHVGAAQCYAELKMPYAAVFHYRKALEVDPGCAETLKQLQALNVAQPLNITNKLN